MENKYSSINAWNELILTLYGYEGKKTIETIIELMELGLIHWLPKWMVLEGGAGTGKSTLIHIICWLFDDWTPISSTSEDFGQYSNSLVICNDADMSKLYSNVTENWELSKDYHILAATNQNLSDEEFDISNIELIRPTGERMPKEKYNENMDIIFSGIKELKTYFRELAKQDFLQRNL